MSETFDPKSKSFDPMIEKLEKFLGHQKSPFSSHVGVGYYVGFICGTHTPWEGWGGLPQANTIISRKQEILGHI